MRIFYLLAIFLFINCTGNHTLDTDLRLWYDQPAGKWEEALPIGNGKSGAMVFGNTDTERLQLNENTLYSGEPGMAFNDIDITKTFDQVVDLMKKEDYETATRIIAKNWLGSLPSSYEPLGDLFIKNNIEDEITGYRRELDISNAIHTMTYSQNGINYKREIFASHPDNLLVIHITSDRKNGIDISLNLTSPHPTAKIKTAEDRIILQGKAPGAVMRRAYSRLESWGDQYKHPEAFDSNGNIRFPNKRVLYDDDVDGKGMLFEAQLKPFLHKGGKCKINNGHIEISDTDDVYLLLSMATSYNGLKKSPSKDGADQSARASSIISSASAYDFETLKERHITDYQHLFNRVSFKLESSEEQKSMTTDRRIIAFKEKTDPDLVTLLFQYGRYLMISGSRPGGQPLNLQGMWNKDTIPAWESAYTMNINTEMNYWPAEVTNLSECHEPLFNFIKELSITGRETAQKVFKRRGWCANHTTGLWRNAVPNDNIIASFWPVVQGWLTSHLWEHFQFTQDSVFLKETAYPLMKGAAEFFSDWLIDNGEGFLVTPVGTSPENHFIHNGKRYTLSPGPTMDMAIIKENFSRTVQIAKMFDMDQELQEELTGKFKKLLPYQIGSKGQLQEWMKDFKEAEPQHRHFSHLYALYPGDQITPGKTPELFNACFKTMELRGDMATGWSMGWKINTWARLLDGNHAYLIIKNMFNPIGFGKGHGGGGLFKSMLDAHPPFQIDGNFGFTSGIAEMILQSHAGFINLLPALPDVWDKGSITGLKARGNFEVSMNWEMNRIKKAEIRSGSGNQCTIRYKLPFKITEGKKTITVSQPKKEMGKEYAQTSFRTEKGRSYHVEVL